MFNISFEPVQSLGRLLLLKLTYDKIRLYNKRILEKESCVIPKDKLQVQ
jgi:hypothetical protein